MENSLNIPWYLSSVSVAVLDGERLGTQHARQFSVRLVLESHQIWFYRARNPFRKWGRVKIGHYMASEFVILSI